MKCLVSEYKKWQWWNFGEFAKELNVFECKNWKELWKNEKIKVENFMDY